jgi:pimeloyl-ACP methyl ester carboxylesterase
MPNAGKWSEQSVGGHPCDLYEPPSANEHGFLLISLLSDDHPRLLDSLALIQQFDRFGLPVVAPHGGRSWWTNRICRQFDAQLTAEQHLLDNIMPFAERQFAAKTRRVALFGFGIGGQGALRFSYKHPDIFPVVAAVAPAIDYQLLFDEDETLSEMYADPEAARQDTALLHIHPLNWPRHQFFCCDPADPLWWEGVDRLRMKLASLGVPHECDLETTAGRDGIAYLDKMAEPAMAFINSRLEQERLRLV